MTPDAVQHESNGAAGGRRGERAASAGDRPQRGDELLGVPVPGERTPCEVLPTLRLMLAVLEQAVEDIQVNRHATTAVRRQIFADAHTWASSSDRSHAFAFLNVCEALGYSPSAIRRRVL